MQAVESTPLVGTFRRGARRYSRDGGGSARARMVGIMTRARSRARGQGEGEGEEGGELGEILGELKSEEKSSRRLFWFAVFCIVNHVVGGSVTLHFLEGWSYYDCIYFCIVTTTTTGYGDITPRRAISKLYVVYYVVFSVGLVASLVAYLVGLLLDQQEEIVLANLMAEEEMEEGVERDVEVGRGGGWISMNDRWLNVSNNFNFDLSDFYGVGLTMIWVLIIVLMGVLIFVYVEDLTLIDAVYTTVVSASTVGFGDFEPTNAWGKMLVSAWLLVATVSVGKVIGDFTDARVKSKQRSVSRRLLGASMDMKSLEAMDGNRRHGKKDGRVDKTEFLSEMLICSGRIEKVEIESILRRFSQLDKDNSGSIEAKECH